MSSGSQDEAKHKHNDDDDSTQSESNDISSRIANMKANPDQLRARAAEPGTMVATDAVGDSLQPGKVSIEVCEAVVARKRRIVELTLEFINL
jgi:hypothetical protein